MFVRLTPAALLLLLIAGGCPSRWSQYQTLRVVQAASDPPAYFRAAVTLLERNGYTFTVVDQAHLRARAAARLRHGLGGDSRGPQLFESRSWINLAVEPIGTMLISAEGDLVQDGAIHDTLATEQEAIAQIIASLQPAELGSRPANPGQPAKLSGPGSPVAQPSVEPDLTRQAGDGEPQIWAGPGLSPESLPPPPQATPQREYRAVSGTVLRSIVRDGVIAHDGARIRLFVALGLCTGIVCDAASADAARAPVELYWTYAPDTNGRLQPDTTVFDQVMRIRREAGAGTVVTIWGWISFGSANDSLPLFVPIVVERVELGRRRD
jgi:hypothetical protein